MLSLRLANRIAWVGLCVPSIVFLMYFGLISSVGWRDEYFLFAFYERAGGIHAVFARILDISPRPLSELLLYGYAMATQHFHRPLIVAVLAPIWLCLMVAAFLSVRIFQPISGIGQRLLLVTTAITLGLLGQPVTEMYFWPTGALAYLLAFAAIVFVTFQAVGDGFRDPQRRAINAAVLILGSACVELAAIFAACFCGLLLVLDVRALYVKRGGTWRIPRQALLGMVALLVPLIFAMGVLALIAVHRASRTFEIVVASPQAHHLWPSLLAALGQLPHDLLAPADAAPAQADPWTNSAVKLLLLCGAASAFLSGWHRKPPRGPALAAAVGLGVTIYLSIAAADFQFGFMCCERHDTFRQGLLMLLIVAVAALLASLPRLRSGVLASWACPLLLVAAVVVLSLDRVPGLLEEYRLYPARLHARSTVWKSGLSLGPEPLHMVFPAGGPIFPSYNLFPTGSYTMGPDVMWLIAGPMLYFHKSSMTVEQMTR